MGWLCLAGCAAACVGGCGALCYISGATATAVVAEGAMEFGIEIALSH